MVDTEGMTVTVVTGPPGCGKSRLVEEAAAAESDKVCYIATLPMDPANERRIIEHRHRRPHYWTTLELAGNLEYDCDQIDEVDADIVILDGFASYLDRFTSPWAGSTPSRVAREVVARLLALSLRSKHLYVVSCATAYAAPRVRRALEQFLMSMGRTGDRHEKGGSSGEPIQKDPLGRR